MKKYSQLIFYTFLLLPLNFQGHTFYREKVKCPIDHVKFSIIETGSMTTSEGSFADFQLRGTIGNHYANMIHSCPKCHFSGFLDDFKNKYPRKIRKQLESHLVKFETTEVDDIIECRIAAELKQIAGSDFSEIGECYLLGSYLLRYKSDKQEFRKEYQTLAAKYYLASFYSFGCQDLADSSRTTYLIAEMNRRTANFDLAIYYYDLALEYSDTGSTVGQYAFKQRQFALEHNDSNNL